MTTITITSKNDKKPLVNTSTGAIQILSATRLQIPGHSQKEINTGLELKISEGYYGLLIEADKTLGNYSLHVRQQIISSAKTYSLKISLFNHSPYPELIIVGQTIAQILIFPMQEVKIRKVAKID